MLLARRGRNRLPVRVLAHQLGKIVVEDRSTSDNDEIGAVLEDTAVQFSGHEFAGDADAAAVAGEGHEPVDEGFVGVGLFDRFLEAVPERQVLEVSNCVEAKEQANKTGSAKIKSEQITFSHTHDVVHLTTVQEQPINLKLLLHLHPEPLGRDPDAQLEVGCRARTDPIDDFEKDTDTGRERASVAVTAGVGFGRVEGAEDVAVSSVEFGAVESFFEGRKNQAEKEKIN